MEEEQTPWIPPEYYVSEKPPTCRALTGWQDTSEAPSFARTIKWSPDGTSLLAHCEDHAFRLFDTRNELFSPPLVLQQPAPIVDYAWYPSASVDDPASWCFIASVRECPVKLLDASNGRLRASYKIIDHRERFIAPHVMAFNPMADKLYCGFEDAIEIFNIQRPGKGKRLATTPSKKSKDGLKGIVSALAFIPSYENIDFFAAGSLTPSLSNIVLYSDGAPLMFIGGTPQASVTQLHFHPTKPHILFASFRRTETIYTWDVRTRCEVPLAKYDYSTPGQDLTNQKTRFDVDWGGRWLSVGDQRGTVHMFDLASIDSYDAENTAITRSYASFQGHSDSIGSVGFHHTKPILVSASGSRHFAEEDSDEEVEGDVGLRRVVKRQPRSLDSSLKLWNFAQE